MEYYIVQNPRKETTSHFLFLADRNKTKQMWWTGSLGLAIRFTSDIAAQAAASRLRFNTPRVVSAIEATEMASRNKNSRNLQEMRNAQYEHPFSSEGLGQ
jgi:hypothetical protein